MDKINKIILVGNSLTHSRFFSNSVLGKDEEDMCHMTSILEDIYKLPVTSYNISGTGSYWTRDCVISHLNDIDEHTLVITVWSTVDRIELYFNPDIPNSELGIPDVHSDVDMFKTFSPDGTPTDKGLRFWVTGSYNVGIRRDISKKFHHEAIQLKEILESLALVQKLVAGKGAQHKCVFVHDLFTLRSRSIKNHLKRVWKGTEPEYQYINLRAMDRSVNLIDKYPELQPWYDMVDWSIVTESLTDYLSDNQLPWYAGPGPHNTHQPPYNLYRFVTDVLYGQQDCMLEDKYIDIHNQFCELYNVKYPNLF